jgi:hypothetical protein
MCGTAMRRCRRPAGSKATSRTKGSRRDLGPVPPSLTVTTPSSRTPAFRHFWIRRSMRGSLIRCFRKRTSHSWLTESKSTGYVLRSATLGLGWRSLRRSVGRSTSRANRPWSPLVIKPYFRIRRCAPQLLTHTKELPHDDFAYRIRMIRLENTRCRVLATGRKPDWPGRRVFLKYIVRAYQPVRPLVTLSIPVVVHQDLRLT